MTLFDLKRVFKLLGSVGMRAGLLASDLDQSVLRDLVEKARLDLKGDHNREIMIDAIIKYLDKPAMKPTEQLMNMNYEELVSYFNETSPSNDQLLQIMKDLNYKVSAEDKKHLRRYVARQISETALFSQVATRDNNRRSR